MTLAALFVSGAASADGPSVAAVTGPDGAQATLVEPATRGWGGIVLLSDAPEGMQEDLAYEGLASLAHEGCEAIEAWDVWIGEAGEVMAWRPVQGCEALDAPAEIVAMRAAARWAEGEGDPDYGAYLAQDCASCHGGGGAIPPLEGMPGAYVLLALAEYENGARDNAAMASVARSLDDEMRAALAAWLATEGPDDG